MKLSLCAQKMALFSNYTIDWKGDNEMQILPNSKDGLFQMNEITTFFEKSCFCNFNDIIFAFYNNSFLFFWGHKLKVNNDLKRVFLRVLPAHVAVSGDIG